MGCPYLHVKVFDSSPGLFYFQSNFLPKHNLGGSRWWPKYCLSPCYPHGRLEWNFRLSPVCRKHLWNENRGWKIFSLSAFHIHMEINRNYLQMKVWEVQNHWIRIIQSVLQRNKPMRQIKWSFSSTLCVPAVKQEAQVDIFHNLQEINDSKMDRLKTTQSWANPRPSSSPIHSSLHAAIGMFMEGPWPWSYMEIYLTKANSKLLSPGRVQHVQSIKVNQPLDRTFHPCDWHRL